METDGAYANLFHEQFTAQVKKPDTATSAVAVG
jgi:hypothetical protein